MTHREPRAVSKHRGEVLAIIDGAARGNPGPAAYGVVFKDTRGKVLARLNKSLGRATNNVAEYRALLAALAYARSQGWHHLKVLTDSELLARQLTGAYRVRSVDLKPLHAEAQREIAELASFAAEAVPRRLTREADRLANAALKQRPVTRLSRAESRDATGKRSVQAIYQGGVLKPLAPLDLEEGEEVELTLRRKPQR
ncbi:MAG: reverse transcriptase-like protein [Terriglobia bacterium]